MRLENLFQGFPNGYRDYKIYGECQVFYENLIFNVMEKKYEMQNK